MELPGPRVATLSTVLVSLALFAMACSVDEASTVSDDATAGPTAGLVADQRAEVIDEFEGSVLAMAPAGDLALVAADPDDDLPGLEVCIVELDTGNSRDCINDPLVTLGSEAGDVSADGQHVVFSNRANPDVFLLDFVTGDIENLTDDGVIEIAPEDFGKGPLDTSPVFTPSGQRIIFLRDRAQFVLYDVAGRAEIEALDLPTVAPGAGQIPVGFAPALPINEDRALFGGPGAVFELDFVAGTVTEVFDYSQTFRPNPEVHGFNLPDEPILDVLHILDDGRMMLYDFGVWNSLNQTGGAGGYTSGVYVADPSDGSLAALFETSDLDDGWVGPFGIVPTGDPNTFVVPWVLSGDLNDDTAARVLRLSLLDLDAVRLPLEPLTMPGLWRSTGADALNIAQLWYFTSPAVSARSTMLVDAHGRRGERTLLLDLSGN